MQNALTAIHPKTYPNGRQNLSKIALARTDSGSWQEQLYRLNPLLEEFNNLSPQTEDAYFSLNGFGPYRRIDCLVQINCCFTDIDIYSLFAYNLEFVMGELEKLIPHVIPRPGIICYSGRGLWPIWPIIPVPREALMRWKRVQEYLVQSLAHLGADLKAKDVTRVIRVDGSINSKNGQQVMFEIQPGYKPLSLHDFEKYLPPVVRKDKQSKPRSLTPVHPKLFTPYSLNLTIIEDLKRLADGRKRNLLGHREYFLFIWRNCLAQLGESPEDSERQLKCVALQYLGTERLPDREWVRSTLSAHRASFERYKHVEVQGYRLTKQWIIDALAITPEEQTKMQFLIGTAEKYDRNNKRRYKQRRQEYLGEVEERRDLIRQAKAADPNLTQRQLADLFKCSAATVFRALKD